MRIASTSSPLVTLASARTSSDWPLPERLPAGSSSATVFSAVLEVGDGEPARGERVRIDEHPHQRLAVAVDGDVGDTLDRRQPIDDVVLDELASGPGSACPAR